MAASLVAPIKILLDTPSKWSLGSWNMLSLKFVSDSDISVEGLISSPKINRSLRNNLLQGWKLAIRKTLA